MSRSVRPHTDNQAFGPRRLGHDAMHPVALGGMLLSIEGRPDEHRAVQTIRAAVEAGATLIDTADAYHIGADEVGHNESLVARALEGMEPRPIVATKGGRVRPGDGRWLTDSSPEHLYEAAHASLIRLGSERIDLYQLHAPDPDIPYRRSLLALRNLVDDGVASSAGVSNVDVPHLELALDVLGDRLVSVQDQFSPTHREATDVLRMCEELGLAFLAWRPLGRVIREPHSAVALAFGRIAQELGVSVARVVLAWDLATSPVLIPLVGATRPETARDSLAVTTLQLSPDVLVAGLQAVLPGWDLR